MKRHISRIASWFFVITMLTTHSSFAIEQENANAEPAPENEAGSQNQVAADKAVAQGSAIERAAKQRIEHLRAQYPPEQIRQLEAEGEQFTALWRKDRSGAALGAVLLVPAVGQTANWPNTIDVLRNELSVNGWSTLSIDLKIPHWKHKSSKSGTETETLDTHNLARISAAIEFLHSEGQYNIVLAGYGESAERILNYSGESGATGMRKTVPSSTSAKRKRPVRALILISAIGRGETKLSPMIETYPHKDMPFLDITFGAHYLDTFDADARKSAARANGIKAYIQFKTVEPNSMVFSAENRLSRRVRGFLNRHAKGVEIDKR